MFNIITNHLPILLNGFGTTLLLLALIMTIGIPVGIGVGIVAGRYCITAKKVLDRTQFILKAVPVLVFLFWLHYPLQALFQVVVNPFLTTVIALSFINVITIASLVANELSLLPKAYREAGQTLRMSQRQIIRHIELPLLMRHVLPSILLTQAAMLEYTLLSSLISVPELFRTAQTLNSMIYQPIAIYSLLVVFFAAILLPLHIGARKLQEKYASTYA